MQIDQLESKKSRDLGDSGLRRDGAIFIAIGLVGAMNWGLWGCEDLKALHSISDSAAVIAIITGYAIPVGFFLLNVVLGMTLIVHGQPGRFRISFRVFVARIVRRLRACKT